MLWGSINTSDSLNVSHKWFWWWTNLHLEMIFVEDSLVWWTWRKSGLTESSRASLVETEKGKLEHVNLYLVFQCILGLPWWLSGKGSACQCDARDVSLIPRSGRSPGEGKWPPTPVFLPGKFHGQRSLVGYSAWGCKECDMTEYTAHIMYFTFEISTPTLKSKRIWPWTLNIWTIFFSWELGSGGCVQIWHCI